MNYAIALLVLLLMSVSPVYASSLKLGILPAADTLLLHVAAEEGLFEKHGVPVELIPFSSALEQGTALRAGALDGHFTDLVRVLVLNETGVPQAIVVNTSGTMPNSRRFALVVPKDSVFENFEAMRGANVAVSTATIIDFMLSQFLAEGAVSEDFLKPMDINQISVRLQMLNSGQIDSAILPEPLVSLAESTGAKAILDDTSLDGIPLTVIALTQPVLERPDAPHMVAGMRAALSEAATRINDNPEKYRTVMAEKKLLPQKIASSYKMLQFSPDQIKESVLSEDDISLYSNWMKNKGILKSSPVYEKVVYK